MTVGELVAVIERLVAGRGAAVHLRLVKGPKLAWALPNHPRAGGRIRPKCSPSAVGTREGVPGGGERLRWW